MEPELIADYACVCGEGPLWHPKEERLYWVDIPKGRLFRYSPASGQHEKCWEGDPIGGFTVQQDGALLLFMAKGAVRIWREGGLTTVLEEIPDERETRFNDVIADPAGRVFCGTMPAPNRPGRLYRLDTNGRLTKLLDGIGCSNGMGFTPDRKRMYYTDTRAHTIYLFDYEKKTGALANQRPFVQSLPAEGGPDGMTVDAEGCVWSARWDGSMLVRFSASGKELLRVPFPAKKVSSVIFGGKDYDEVYVTTAGGDHKDTDGPLAGGLFRLKPGVKGVPEFCSKVRPPK